MTLHTRKNPNMAVTARVCLAVACAGLLAAGAVFAQALREPPETIPSATEWPSYGNDAGGSRYAPLGDITPDNVHRLEVAWSYRTGDVSDGRGEIPSTTALSTRSVDATGPRSTIGLASSSPPRREAKLTALGALSSARTRGPPTPN